MQTSGKGTVMLEPSRDKQPPTFTGKIALSDGWVEVEADGVRTTYPARNVIKVTWDKVGPPRAY